MTDRISQLTELFIETGKAHHEAFLDTGGVDADWPIWYADYLMDKLPGLLEADFTRSELIYLLVRLSREHALEAPGSKWPRYYAQVLAARYFG